MLTDISVNLLPNTQSQKLKPSGISPINNNHLNISQILPHHQNANLKQTQKQSQNDDIVNQQQCPKSSQLFSRRLQSKEDNNNTSNPQHNPRSILETKNRNMSENNKKNPSSITKPSQHKKGGSISNPSSMNVQSVFLHNEKIILPVKEYSNKFLRENKPRDEILYTNSRNKNNCNTIIKPKSKIWKKNGLVKNTGQGNRNELSYGRRVHSQYHNGKNNSSSFNTYNSHSHQPSSENMKKIIKTQISQQSHCSTSKKGLRLNKSQMMPSEEDLHNFSMQRPQSPCMDHFPSNVTPLNANINKISTSRALELFSKVYRQEGIERMKIKKQIVNRTADVHVKQLVLQEKQDYQTHHILKKDRGAEIWQNDQQNQTIILKYDKNSGILKDRLNYKDKIKKQQTNKLAKNNIYQKWNGNKKKNSSSNYGKSNCWMQDDENFQLVGW